MLYQRGLYSEMQALSPNLGAWLAARVSAHVGQAVTVQLIHDGTAAARVYAGSPIAPLFCWGRRWGWGFLLSLAEISLPGSSFNYRVFCSETRVLI